MSSWVENPDNLFARTNLFPDTGDPFGEKLNALTRLLIVVVVVLVLLKWKYWHIILTVGIFLVIFFYLLKSEPDIVENFNENMEDLKHYGNKPEDTKCPCQRKGKVVSPPVTYTTPALVEAPISQDVPWEQLCTYVKCEAEFVPAAKPESTPQVFEKETKPAQISKVRGPRTGVVIRAKDPTKKTSYDLYQESYDFERKNGPPIPDMSGVINIL